MDIREKTRRQAEVMLAFADGKDVESRYENGEAWCEAHNPLWDWDSFDYRVKKQELKPGGNYKTRDGRDVRIYAVDGFGDYPVHGALLVDGEWLMECWTEEGMFRKNVKNKRDRDIIL